MAHPTPVEVANRWIEAYNTQDYATIRELCAPDIKMTHHNRDFSVVGADAIVGSMEEFEQVGPDKRFTEPRTQYVAGDTVITQQVWTFTATIDVPVFEAKAGEVTALDLACIWTVRDGQVVEYHDYG